MIKNWMKINWRGRVVFKNVEAIHSYYLLAFNKGKKAGYKLRLSDESKEKAANVPL